MDLLEQIERALSAEEAQKRKNAPEDYWSYGDVYEQAGAPAVLGKAITDFFRLPYRLNDTLDPDKNPRVAKFFGGDPGVRERFGRFLPNEQAPTINTKADVARLVKQATAKPEIKPGGQIDVAEILRLAEKGNYTPTFMVGPDDKVKDMPGNVGGFRRLNKPIAQYEEPGIRKARQAMELGLQQKALENEIDLPTKLGMAALQSGTGFPGPVISSVMSAINLAKKGEVDTNEALRQYLPKAVKDKKTLDQIFKLLKISQATN